MFTKIIAYLSVLIFTLALDGIWLSIMVPRLYQKSLPFEMAVPLNFAAAGLFYMIFAFGETMFVVMPAHEGRYSLLSTFLTGACFGLVAYAAYDLTNQATVKDWPLVITVVDMIWGAAATGTASTLALSVVRKLG